MNIKDALNIVSEGKNKHFDEALVNVFMTISAYDILCVVNSDDEKALKKDEIFLKEFNLQELYDILNIEKNALTKQQQNKVDMFNKYYNYNLRG